MCVIAYYTVLLLKQVLGTHLVLVSGVERDLCNFLILVPHGLDGATGQFDTLQ